MMATPTTKANQLCPSMAKHPGCRELARRVKMWPTPTASERSGINPKTGSGAGLSRAVKADQEPGMTLHPSFVSWMMGWPLGFESLDDLPPNSMADWDQAMADGSWWIEEPDIPRVGKNIPARKDRLKVLGNGMVPICFVAAVLDLLQLVESLDEN